MKKCNHTCLKEYHEDFILTKNILPLLLANCTQSIMSGNPPFSYFGKGYLTNAKPFLIAKLLKPRLHFIL